MDIYANIKQINYKPTLCSKLKTYNFQELGTALSKKGSFLLRIDSTNQIAVSWWVSPKRTRSYPYARVYDTLAFSGKRVTIIPVIKEEGKEGDRDFLQWDTISLMTLLNVNVVIAYYADASKSDTYEHKITKQRFDLEHINGQIEQLQSYQSDSFHWNTAQARNIGNIGQMALNAYRNIAQQLNVEMHSFESAEERINVLREDSGSFRSVSRKLAKQAQASESVTTQPKEQITGIKGTLTIKNFVGGHYYWTGDEIEIHGNQIFIIEAKHTTKDKLPSSGDIKDALVKMMLFTNLENVKVCEKEYVPIPILKLTTGAGFSLKSISRQQKNWLRNLRKEAEINGFRVSINGEYLTLKALE